MIIVKKYHKNGNISDVLKYRTESDFLQHKEYKHIFYNLKGEWMPAERTLRQLSDDKLVSVKKENKYIFSIFITRKNNQEQYAYILYQTIEELVDAFVAFVKPNIKYSEESLFKIFKREYKKNLSLKKTLNLVLSNPVDYTRDDISCKLMGSRIISFDKKFKLFENGELFQIMYESIDIIEEEEKETNLCLKFLNRANGQHINLNIGMLCLEEDIWFTQK